MQDSYVGDIGDFGKLVLLRRLEKEGFKIGINWYRTNLSGAPKDGDYEIPYFFEDSLEGKLAAQLRELFYAKPPLHRSIEALEELHLIENNLYFHDIVPQTEKERTLWYKKSQETLQDSTLIFLDPDNGLLVDSVKAYSKKSIKYVYIKEIMKYLENKNCRCVLFYNHRSRMKPDPYFSKKREQLEAHLKTNYPIAHITFPRRAIRDYFAVCKDEKSYDIVKNTFDDLIQSDWGPSGYGLCRGT